MRFGVVYQSIFWLYSLRKRKSEVKPNLIRGRPNNPAPAFTHARNLGVEAYFSRSHALVIFLFGKTLVVYEDTATVTAKLNIPLFNHRPAPETPRSAKMPMD